jgi:hypothetical protein
MKEVKTGISTAEYIEIISGINEGDAVVVTSVSSSSNNAMRGKEMVIMGAPPSGGGGNFKRSN